MTFGDRSPDLDLDVRGGARSSLGMIGRLLMLLVMAPIRVLAWIWRQITGTARGLLEIAGKFSFDRILPNGVVGFIQEIRQRLEWAFGAGSKSRGVFSGIVLIIIGILTSFTGVGIVLIAFGAVLVGFNLIRAIPAFGSAWEGSSAQRAIKRDHDLPLWSRDD